MAGLKMEDGSALNLLPDLFSILPNESSLIRIIETVSHNQSMKLATGTVTRPADQ